MKRTFSALTEDSSSSEDESINQTWFKVPNESSGNLLSFFLRSTHEQEDLPSKFVPVNHQDSIIQSSSGDEICGEFQHLSLKVDSVDIDWQVKQRGVETMNNLKTTSEQQVEKTHVKEVKVEDDFIAGLDDDGGLPDLLNESNLLLEDSIKAINSKLPASAIGYPWKLLYSTYNHGMSLKTLYRKVNNEESKPCLFLVKDQSSHIFGAYCSCQPHLSEHFYGTGESFLFTLSPHIKFFNWTGLNNFFVKGHSDCLIFGGGDGKVGLWIDENLYHGSSQPCSTYDNEMLSSSLDFSIEGIEVWSFDSD